MTSTLCQSTALGRIIAELFGIIVRTILSMVENVSNTFHEPGVCCREGWMAGAASRDRSMIVPPGLDDVAGCVCLADPGAAPTWIAETARVRSRCLPVAAQMPAGRSWVSKSHKPHH